MRSQSAPAISVSTNSRPVFIPPAILTQPAVLVRRVETDLEQVQVQHQPGAGVASLVIYHQLLTHDRPRPLGDVRCEISTCRRQ
jgi:hypothetical protein